MSLFKDVSLEWEGKTYPIKAHRRMKAIACIEGIITLPELYQYAQNGAAPVARLSMAYAAVLNYAGARVSDEECYIGMFGAGGGLKAEDVASALTNLLQMMVPPMPDVPAGEGKEKPGEPAAGNALPAAGAS